MARQWLGVAALALTLAGCAWSGSRPTATPATTARLAYVAEDDLVYTVPAEGGDPRRVDSIPGEQPIAGEMRLSRWPTWTPDGSRLSFMRLRSGEGDAPATATVWTVAPDGSDLQRIWESQDEAPVYMAWAPNASTLALLVQRNNDLALLLVDPAGGQPPRKLAEGGPLYFAWSPDAAELLVHVGGDHRSNPKAELSVVRPGPPEERRPLGAFPANFRAAAWSPDGRKLAFIAEAPGNTGVLTVTDAEGGATVRIAPVGEEGVLLWAPDGDRIAFSSRSPTDRVFYAGLEVIKSDGSGRSQVTQEPVMAFFWSPDGSKLAFAGVDRRAQALAWFVSDAAGKNPKQIGAFVPSQDQIRHFAFFDQYAQSHALWSPDSRYLVYAGLPPGTRSDGPAARRSQIYVAPADGSSEPKVVVDGNLALWPARASRPR